MTSNCHNVQRHPLFQNFTTCYNIPEVIQQRARANQKASVQTPCLISPAHSAATSIKAENTAAAKPTQNAAHQPWDA